MNAKNLTRGDESVSAGPAVPGVPVEFALEVEAPHSRQEFPIKGAAIKISRAGDTDISTKKCRRICCYD